MQIIVPPTRRMYIVEDHSFFISFPEIQFDLSIQPLYKLDLNHDILYFSTYKDNPSQEFTGQYILADAKVRFFIDNKHYVSIFANVRADHSICTDYKRFPALSNNFTQDDLNELKNQFLNDFWMTKNNLECTSNIYLLIDHNDINQSNVEKDYFSLLNQIEHKTKENKNWILESKYVLPFDFYQERNYNHHRYFSYQEARS